MANPITQSNPATPIIKCTTANTLTSAVLHSTIPELVFSSIILNIASFCPTPFDCEYPNLTYVETEFPTITVIPTEVADKINFSNIEYQIYADGYAHKKYKIFNGNQHMGYVDIVLFRLEPNNQVATTSYRPFIIKRNLFITCNLGPLQLIHRNDDGYNHHNDHGITLLGNCRQKTIISRAEFNYVKSDKYQLGLSCGIVHLLSTVCTIASDNTLIIRLPESGFEIKKLTKIGTIYYPIKVNYRTEAHLTFNQQLRIEAYDRKSVGAFPMIFCTVTHKIPASNIITQWSAVYQPLNKDHPHFKTKGGNWSFELVERTGITGTANKWPKTIEYHNANVKRIKSQNPSNTLTIITEFDQQLFRGLQVSTGPDASGCSKTYGFTAQ